MKFKGLSIGYKRERAYIYLWVSKEMRVVYVGQTNEKNAVIGRAIGHISENGTLRKRCFEEGLVLENIDDFMLLSYELPNEKRFISVESSFRLAVEYLVQVKLHEVRAKLNPIFKIISKVTYTDCASDNNIIKIADDIVTDFVNIYKQI